MFSLLHRHLLPLRYLLYFILILFNCVANAATYNLSNGSYPPCNTSWSVSGSTYICNGNGRVTLPAGDIVIANSAATIRADDGFILGGNNTIGSLSAPINLTSSYGPITASNTTIFGNVNAGSGLVTLTNTAVNGTLTSVGNINLTGGRVSGLVRSVGNVITTNGTNLGGGAMAQSGMTITGGTITGNFVMTANNTATFSNVTMTSGSISGASTVNIQNGSVLGSASSSIPVNSTSGPITVNGSTVYGSLTAPSYSTVNVINNGSVYGTCIPGSTPTNACNAASPTPASLGIAHASVGITCAAEPITIIARNSAGVEYNPPAGTLVTLSTSPATGIWVGGNTFTFSGSESRFTKYLRKTTPGAITIRAEIGTLFATSSINFVDTALKIQRNSTEVLIDTQIAGQNGNAIAKVISTNPKTGVCEARVASRTLQAGLGFVCNNPTTCVNGQTFSVNGVSIAANNSGSGISYSNVNLSFNSNGEAPLTINYSDVGQVTLHGRLTIPESGVDPQITLVANTNPFVVKPHTLAISSVTNATNVANPGTTNSGSGFVAAGEKFKVSVQARNFAGNPTPNFGKEISPQINNVVLSASSLVYPAGSSLTALVSEGAFTAATSAGSYVNSDILWNQVGSIVISPKLDNYLGQGAIPNYISSGTVGRFYPHRYVLTNTDSIATCSINPSAVPPQRFLYMGQTFNAENVDPTAVGLQFMLHAVDIDGNPVTNYDPDFNGDGSATIDDAYSVAAVDFATFSGSQKLDARLVNNAGVKLTPGGWVKGVINVNQPQAQFGRLPTPDGPFVNVKVGLAIKDCLDKRLLGNANLTLDTTSSCNAPDNNAYELARFDARYGRLRLDDAFGPETARLAVNFSTEYWTGGFWAKNPLDKCTVIDRSVIKYPSGSILSPANLTVELNGGETEGVYDVSVIENDSVTASNIGFAFGDAKHFFTQPTGAATGKFSVDVDLTNYTWLRFDWDRQNGVPPDLNCMLPKTDMNRSPDCNLRANYQFGSYRGHDRVIYWRERFNP
jgi:MSHA biogenesis protein MshQ